MGFQLYSGNTDKGLKDGKARALVVRICLRNSWASKLEMSVVEICGQIFLLSEVKMKFSIEQKVFIVCVYYIIKAYKKVREEFLVKYTDWSTLSDSSIKRVVDKFEQTYSVHGDRQSRG